MAYSEDFKKAVKKAFPLNNVIHNLVDRGNHNLGRVLDDQRTNIDPNYILNCKSLKEAKKEAKRVLNLEKLYLWWSREWIAQII